ncbi:MAG: dual specificity protein phosphatase family protein [bacterium]|nr:dual specificity protein phosphatase family protein [bacterium]
MNSKNSEHQLLDYNQITEQIFIGTNACCQTHFEKELLAKGMRADISLEEHHLDAPYGVEYFLWLPTKDHRPPSPRQLKLGVKALQDLVEESIKVYVHCHNGHGRAPTLVAAFFISQGQTVDEAIKLIHEKRPVIHPEQSQIEALRDFAELEKYS